MTGGAGGAGLPGGPDLTIGPEPGSDDAGAGDERGEGEGQGGEGQSQRRGRGSRPPPWWQSRRRGLWRHGDFLKLWSGQTISLGGSLIGRFALPFVAITTLHATPFQVAAIGAAGVAPGLLLGLPAGVWVDRLPRRPLLIAADLGRSLVLASVPLAWALGRLGVAQLLVVAALTGALNLLFEVAYRAYLPGLIGRDELVDGNSKLAATDSVAEVAGFGVAGVLVQALGAPLAVLFDAASFVVSTIALALIRTPEVATPADPDAPPDARRELAEGVRLLRREPTLRAIALAVAADLFFIHIFVAGLTLFLTRELGLGPAIQGATFAIGGISAFAGATLARRVVRRWGLGRALLGSFLVYRVGTFAIPLAAGPTPLVVGLIGGAQLLDAAATIQQISQTSLIQAVTPDRLLGRFYASLRTIEQVGMLLGLLLGGLLAERVGLRATLLLGIAGSLLTVPWFLGQVVRASDG